MALIFQMNPVVFDYNSLPGATEDPEYLKILSRQRGHLPILEANRIYWPRKFGDIKNKARRFIRLANRIYSGDSVGIGLSYLVLGLIESFELGTFNGADVSIDNVLFNLRESVRRLGDDQRHYWLAGYIYSRTIFYNYSRPQYTNRGLVADSGERIPPKQSYFEKMDEAEAMAALLALIGDYFGEGE